MLYSNLVRSTCTGRYKQHIPTATKSVLHATTPDTFSRRQLSVHSAFRTSQTLLDQFQRDAERYEQQLQQHKYVQQQHRRVSESQGGESAPLPHFQVPAQAEFSKHPVLQYPSRNLLQTQYPIAASEIDASDNTYVKMVGKLLETRDYYQYPSLSAPQIGWNVQLFCLYDGTVYVNPQLSVPTAIPDVPGGVDVETLTRKQRRELKKQQLELEDAAQNTPVEGACEHTGHLDAIGYAWEPDASAASILHYIPRPLVVDIAYVDGNLNSPTLGKLKKRRLGGMLSRLVQHEMDHMRGINHCRRIPNSNHVCPIDGFHAMSQWECDFPSLEAASTNLYTIYVPPQERGRFDLAQDKQEFSQIFRHMTSADDDGDDHENAESGAAKNNMNPSRTALTKHKFASFGLTSSDLLKRHCEDAVFPEHETLAQMDDERRKYDERIKEFIKKQKTEADEEEEEKNATTS